MSGDPVTLGQLADTAGRLQSVHLTGGAGVAITDLHHDSRRIDPGSGFIALTGRDSDGHAFAAEAVSRGAAGVVVERPVQVDVPQLVVEATRPLMGPLAAAVHGDPSGHLAIVGVTGTNGKTTVTHMVESAAAAGGLHPGLVGTLGAHAGGEVIDVGHTTPEATDLQRLLARMRDAGTRLVAMEVSSHALVYGRVDAVRFSVAAFTNLSQDHLDFHGDMDRYFAAKRMLFTPERSDRAVVLVDDGYGAALAAERAIPTTTVSLSGAADVTCLDFESRPEGTRMKIRSNIVEAEGHYEIELPMGAWFNAANAMVAWTCGAVLGIDPAHLASGLASLRTVPGRLEPVTAGQPFSVIVDYAHTPEAMTRAIEALRPEPPGRVIALGGAGGDRDRGKRPLMGAALAGADVAVLTSDNPRSEDPLEILSAVEAGARRENRRVDVEGDREIVVEPDRRAAIRLALERARPGDVVVLLGKGHETGQESAGSVAPFDDRAVAAEELGRLGDEGRW